MPDPEIVIDCMPDPEIVIDCPGFSPVLLTEIPQAGTGGYGSHSKNSPVTTSDVTRSSNLGRSKEPSRPCGMRRTDPIAQSQTSRVRVRLSVTATW